MRTEKKLWCGLAGCFACMVMGMHGLPMWQSKVMETCPQTGDETAIFGWALAAVTSAGILGISIYYNKKRNSRK